MEGGPMGVAGKAEGDGLSAGFLLAAGFTLSVVWPSKMLKMLKVLK
jgi:hypothetical protein